MPFFAALLLNATGAEWEHWMCGVVCMMRTMESQCVVYSFVDGRMTVVLQRRRRYCDGRERNEPAW